MGRVYKALVKADKWQERDRAIGRPEQVNAEPARRIARPSLAENSATVNETVFVSADPLDLTEEFVAPKTTHSSGITNHVPINHNGAATVAPAPRSQAPCTVTSVQVQKEVQPTPNVSSARVIVEASIVANIQDLMFDPHIAALCGDDHVAREQYRTLAVKLLSLADRRNLKTLLVTSAEPGEGKTTVAVGAAWMLAKHPERRVLLIDANATDSTVGRMLGVDAPRGWLNVISGSCSLTDALIQIQPNGLYVLAAGAAVRQSAFALASGLEKLLSEISSHFDLIFLDSGSILESPEAQRLATQAGGVVIVTRANQTHHSQVSAARKLVPKNRRLGIVLNKADGDALIAKRKSKRNSLVGRLFGRKI